MLDNYLVIMVDDDKDERDYFHRLFAKRVNKLDHNFLTFASGTEFTKKVYDLMRNESRPLCILLDYEMPGLNGKQVIEFLRTSEDNILRDSLVFLLSSSPTHEEILLEKGCRPTGFLRKSVKPIDLSTALTSL